MPAGPALFIDEEPNRDKKEITAIRREVFECDSKQNQGKMKVNNNPSKFHDDETKPNKSRLSNECNRVWPCMSM